MSDDELNKQAHEALGFCWPIGKEFTDDGFCVECGICVSQHRRPVDFINDLNHASELEAFGLANDPFDKYDERSFRNRYTDELEKLCGDSVFDIATAPALTRVKACLAALSNGGEV